MFSTDDTHNSDHIRFLRQDEKGQRCIYFRFVSQTEWFIQTVACALLTKERSIYKCTTDPNRVISRNALYRELLLPTR